jgi:hypothetical protein
MCVDYSGYVVVEWSQSEVCTRCLNHRSVACLQAVDPSIPKLSVCECKVLGEKVVFLSHPAFVDTSTKLTSMVCLSHQM